MAFRSANGATSLRVTAYPEAWVGQVNQGDRDWDGAQDAKYIEELLPDWTRNRVGDVEISADVSLLFLALNENNGKLSTATASAKVFERK